MQCRAFAAAIFGDPSKANIVPITFAERWDALQSRTVDVIGGTTHTMERDVYQVSEKRTALVVVFFPVSLTEIANVPMLAQGDVGAGFSFSVPTFYDGLHFAGMPAYVACVDEVDTTTGICPGLKICITEGTSWADIVAFLFPEENYMVTPGIGFAELAAGTCNVVGGESPDLVQMNAVAEGFVGDYAVSEFAFSSEPLAWVSMQGDPRFSDIINWVVMAILTAEEEGVTMETASALGTYGGLGTEYETMFIDAVAAVGNYKEIYERSVEAYVPRGGLNAYNFGGSGLIYSLPFGAETTGSAPAEGSTIDLIKTRGVLNCGIREQPGLDEINEETMMWEGFDVDFCRALSAALFNGDKTKVAFIHLDSTERFGALADGTVDVLSRKTTATLSRDMMESSTGVGFSFSSPNFYDGMAFGKFKLLLFLLWVVACVSLTTHSVRHFFRHFQEVCRSKSRSFSFSLSNVRLVLTAMHLLSFIKIRTVYRR